MSEGVGNYSFYNHNLQRPTIQPNLLVKPSSSENALNNFESLSILSPTADANEQQFAGEPLVAGFVPHPPSGPRTKGSTPVRFRGKKRLRNESPRTSGSEDERLSRKQTVSTNVSTLSNEIRSSSAGSLDGFHSDPEFQRRRHFRKLEPLQGITSRKDIVGSFKTYQHSAKLESLSQPLKVVHDSSGNDNDEQNLKPKNVEQNTNRKNDLTNDDGSYSNSVAVSEDDSFTNVSCSSDDDDDQTLSSSSDSDEELRKKSEEIADALLSKRYPNATLPSIPKGSVGNDTTLYENMDANISAQLSNTYETVGGDFQSILHQNQKHQGHYSSAAELSRKEGSEFSYTSQISLLPRVDIRTVRLRNTNFLQEEMEKYFPEHKLSLFVATWNMHEEKGVPGYLDDFLLPENIDFLPDIYVIGLQESTSLRKEWEIKLQETLGPSHVLMYSTTFGVLHMAVFIRRELVWFCSAVNQNNVATRPGHMIKTKGGLAVSFSLFGTSFLFINSHLTSDEGKAKDRINDYNIIRKSLTLQAVEKPLIDNRPDVTDRFDRVFWLGDFNFRVDLKRQEVDQLLNQNSQQNSQSLKEMMSHDQLTNLMNKGEVFCGFTEPAVNFPPTYKYDLNSDDYDTSSKARVPSWTDRILFKSPDKDAIKSTCYSACSSVTISDHRPVYGIYEVNLKPCKKSVPLTGGQFVRDVYIEANRRRATINHRNQQDSSVCTIL